MKGFFISISLLLAVSGFASTYPIVDADTIPSPGPKKSFLIFPIAERSLETSWGFGQASVMFFRPKISDSTTRTSDVSLLTMYTLKSQLILALNSNIFFPHENNILRFQSSYSYFPDHFWGLGNNTPATNDENFTQKQFFINPQFLKRIHKDFYLGLSYEFQHSSDVNYTAGGIFDQQNVVGRFGGQSSGIGPIITWDTRNSSYSPTQGLFAEMQYISFGKFLGSDFKFTLFNMDYRQYFPVNKKAVFAMQAILNFGNGEVPFRKLAELGGSEMNRGYYSGRFTDKCQIAYQAEWRQFLFWRLGVVGFASMGQVSPSSDKFSIDGFHYAWGGGLRFQISKKERLNLRIDYGMGQNTQAFNFQLREAF
jgi:outer membrane protein assembly factor BamA